ncbi:MAG: Rnf-Nqr domain containing protein [Gammaproteobacteria bacterium]
MNLTSTDTSVDDRSTPRATWQLGVLIGLCPLLGASRSFDAGLALGLGSLAVLLFSNMFAATVGRLLPRRGRTAALLALIGALVTAVDLLFQAYAFLQYEEIGLFVPLIVINCLILDRAGYWSGSQGSWRVLAGAVGDALRQGLVFVLLLAGLGALREVLAPALSIALLPAGALFLLAGLVALRQLLVNRQ